MDTPVTDVVAFTIDTSDASRLARFWADLLGAQVSVDMPEHGYAQVTRGAHVLNFQTVAHYTRPAWPGQQQPQQFHLDLRVSSLADGIAHAQRLGAQEADVQPAPDAYRVLLDPDGHPFCLCPPTA